MKTKAEALSEFRSYMHDARRDGRREGYKVDRLQVWQQMVETWRDAGDITAETAAQWIARGPR